MCVAGDREIDRHIRNIFSHKQIGGRAVEVRSLDRVSDGSGCHLVFVSDSRMKGAARLVEAVSDRSVLLVGESSGFASTGGTINFYLEKGKIRFEINPEAARSSGIKISSRLLKLGRIVERKS